MTTRSLISLAWLCLACGCASTPAHREPPPASPLPMSGSHSERMAYYGSMAVSEVGEDGYVVNGELYSDGAMRRHFRGLPSPYAMAQARSANGTRIMRKIFSIAPAPIGGLVGAYIGLLAVLSSAFSYSSRNVEYYIPLGAVAGAAVGGLAVSLPVSLGLGSKQSRQRREAAEAFNHDLARRLGLAPPGPLPR